MKTKNLLILSVFVLVMTFLTLGCTSLSTVLNNPTPMPTTTYTTDDQGAAPTSTPIGTAGLPIFVPADNQTNVSDTNASPVNTSETVDGSLPYGDTPTPDAGSY